MPLAYLTDTEGRWNKLEDFCRENPLVRLEKGRLYLENGTILIFGGDAVDRGPASLRLLRCLVDAYDRYPGRVVLLAGNRDINKLRLPRELNGHPREGAPTGSRPDLLRWTFAKTMGASHAFAMRQEEIGTDDEGTVDSFLQDVAEGGPLLSYLERACLGWRQEDTLIVHGAVTPENFGIIPGESRVEEVDRWLTGLQDFYRRQIDAFRANPRGTDHAALVAYQAPLPGSRANPQSVVYGRPALPDGNPTLPSAHLREHLKNQGIRRVMVGHTPSGDSPSVLRRDGFELIIADNSYGHLERGAQVLVDGSRTTVRGWVAPGGGPAQAVELQLTLDEPSLLGTHDRHGRLIKGILEDGRYLLFRFLPHFVAEEIAATEPDL